MKMVSVYGEPIMEVQLVIGADLLHLIHAVLYISQALHNLTQILQLPAHIN